MMRLGKRGRIGGHAKRLKRLHSLCCQCSEALGSGFIVVGEGSRRYKSVLTGLLLPNYAVDFRHLCTSVIVVPVLHLLV
jgi:hypothetical protein